MATMNDNMTPSMRFIPLSEPEILYRLGVSTKRKAIERLKRLKVPIVDNGVYWLFVEQAMSNPTTSEHRITTRYSDGVEGL